MDDNEKLYIVVAICSSFSAIGSLFIIIVYAKFKTLHCFSFKLIAILSIFDFIESLLILFPIQLISSEDNSACIFQACLIEFAVLGGCMWTGCICLLLYLQVIRKTSRLEFYLKLCLGFTVCSCIIAAIIPIFTSTYTYVGGNCWITGNTKVGNILRFALFFIIGWVIIISNSITYMRIVRKIKEQMTIQNKFVEEGRLLFSRQRLYPIIMMITYTPLTIVRVIQFIDYSFVPFWLNMVSYGFFTSNGLFNSIVYGFNDTVRQAFNDSSIFEDALSVGFREKINTSL